MVDAFLTMSPDRVLNRQVKDFARNGVGIRMFHALPLKGPLGLWTPGIPENQGGADIDRGATKIETEGGTIFEIW